MIAFTKFVAVLCVFMSFLLCFFGHRLLTLVSRGWGGNLIFFPVRLYAWFLTNVLFFLVLLFRKLCIDFDWDTYGFSNNMPLSCGCFRRYWRGWWNGISICLIKKYQGCFQIKGFEVMFLNLSFECVWLLFVSDDY